MKQFPIRSPFSMSMFIRNSLTFHHHFESNPVIASSNFDLVVSFYWF